MRYADLSLYRAAAPDLRGQESEPLPQLRVAARGATREPEDAALRAQVPGLPALAIAAGAEHLAARCGADSSAGPSAAVAALA